MWKFGKQVSQYLNHWYNIIKINLLSKKAKWVSKAWLKHDEVLKHGRIQPFENSKLFKFRRKCPSICFKESLINSLVKFELRGDINHRCYKNQYKQWFQRTTPTLKIYEEKNMTIIQHNETIINHFAMYRGNKCYQQQQYNNDKFKTKA